MRSKRNCSEGQLLLDFKFQNLKVEHESRPRTGSCMFSVRLDAIYLRDKITTHSIFPLLISPYLISIFKITEDLNTSALLS